MAEQDQAKQEAKAEPASAASLLAAGAKAELAVAGCAGKVENPAPQRSDSIQPKQPVKAKAKLPCLSGVQKAQIEALYVVKCMEQRDVAAALGIPVRNVNQHCYRAGLTAKRDARLKRLEVKTMDKAATEVDMAMERWSAGAESLADSTLVAAEQELAGDSDFKAKNLASYSLAAKNFIGIYKDARGVGNNNGSASVNMLGNFYINAVAPAKPEPAKQADAVDI